MEFSDEEKEFISLCIYMASREGFYLTDDDMDVEELGRVVLTKLGFDKETIEDYMRSY